MRTTPKAKDKVSAMRKVGLVVEFSTAAFYGLPNLVGRSVGEPKALKLSVIVMGIEQALLGLKVPLSVEECANKPFDIWLHEDVDTVRRYCDGKTTNENTATFSGHS